MSRTVEQLAAEFVDLTEEMNDLAVRKQDLAMLRRQVLLQLRAAGLYLKDIGKLVDLSAPTLCRLEQQARKEQTLHARAGQPYGAGYPHPAGSNGRRRP